MKKLIHHCLDAGHPIMVSDRGACRCLQFGLTSCEQSRIDLSNPQKLQIAYTQTMMSGLLFQQQPKRILLLGLGGGSMVHFLLHHLETVQLDVVEQSAGVIRVAHDFFALPGSDRLRLVNTRAEDFLRHEPATKAPGYDLILVDLFGPDCMAQALFDEAFHTLLLTRLSNRGLAIYNLWSGNKDAFGAACSAIDLAFSNRVLRLPVFEDPNICLLAFTGRPPQETSGDLVRIKRLAKRFDLDFERMNKQLTENNKEWAKGMQ